MTAAQNQVTDAKQALAEANLTSPIAGVVAALNTNPFAARGLTGGGGGFGGGRAGTGATGGRTTTSGRSGG